MQTQKINIKQLTPSQSNPRTITSDKLDKLVTSILSFPKMMELRPIVTDKAYNVLGGNMRTHALNKIANMSDEEIGLTLAGSSTFDAKSEAEKTAIQKLWKEWKKSPYAFVVNASDLTEEERKEFMVKDNVSFGQWDWDALANKFDSNLLGDWGMDVWNPTLSFGKPSNAPAEGTAHAPINTGALPEELQGLDITPADIPEITGSDETLMERIIIVFPKDKKEVLSQLLGLATIEKVVYKIDEIIGEA